MIDNELQLLAQPLGQWLTENAMKVAVAESCTGGGLAYVMTSVSGSSQWFDRGFVTYSNAAKMQMLQVNLQSLDQYGAVSKEVALEMVQGTLNNSGADLAVAITGIAGPTGGSDLKPVGTVYIAVGMVDGENRCCQFVFSGGRSNVRKESICHALQECLTQCKN